MGFLRALSATAPADERGHYRFLTPGRHTLGFVQLVATEKLVQIHRLWTLVPGAGGGSSMLRTLCDLADEHQVELKLKALPIGRKPYPMDRKALRDWYGRYGFVGPRWDLRRAPSISSSKAVAQSP